MRNIEDAFPNTAKAIAEVDPSGTVTLARLEGWMLLDYGSTSHLSRKHYREEARTLLADIAAGTVTVEQLDRNAATFGITS